MVSVYEIPEVAALNASKGLIRIPDQIDVPVTPRVMKVVDSEPFQRLIGVRQLGMVPLVYPAANHNRFEHSLGVYRNALLFLRQLGNDSRFRDLVSIDQCKAFVLAALLHDIAHWPFCHLIEDIGLESIPKHESLARKHILSSCIADTIRDDWKIDPESVVRLVEGKKNSVAESLLGSMLSGPIDVDKMDYLYRDSLHAGVPYGKNFDSPRLIGSLCLNELGDKLAITAKGRTAAELMVFARYVMFSEVYWHHAVRSATALFQRAFFEWAKSNDTSNIYSMDDNALIQTLLKSSCETTNRLMNGIFGAQRRLYKRLLAFSLLEHESLFRTIAHRPFEWLVRCGNSMAELLSEVVKRDVQPHEILIDAPPVDLEVQFDVDVLFSQQGGYRNLGSVSPVVNTLARQQFDDHVKQVRIFVCPKLARTLNGVDPIPLLLTAIDRTG